MGTGHGFFFFFFSIRRSKITRNNKKNKKKNFSVEVPSSIMHSCIHVRENPGEVVQDFRAVEGKTLQVLALVGDEGGGPPGLDHLHNILHLGDIWWRGAGGGDHKP